MTTTRLECCLPDCSWSYEIPTPTVPPAGGDFDELVARENARRHARAEAAAIAHLEGHDVVEFATEIQRLRKWKAEAIEVQSHWDAAFAALPLTVRDAALGMRRSDAVTQYVAKAATGDAASTLDGTPSP